MAKPLIAKNKAKAPSTSLLLAGAAILFFLDNWWPAAVLVIGIPLSLKQFLTGRLNDAAISLFVFVGFFIIAQFNIFSWKVLVPIFFIMAAVYVLCKEWVKTSTGEDEDEETTDGEDKK